MRTFIVKKYGEVGGLYPGVGLISGGAYNRNISFVSGLSSSRVLARITVHLSTGELLGQAYMIT